MLSSWMARCSFVLTLTLSVLSAAQTPKITKVEPPNWWIGLPDPMIMITGENLDRAQASVSVPGIHIRRAMEGNNGHYFFIWLEIGKEALPGEIPLVVANNQGKATKTWRLEQRNPAGPGLQPSPNEGFNGFGPDDVIYLIMPDRFGVGNPDPDVPTNDPSLRAYHGGNLRKIQERLPYLKDVLGVTTLWLTPIYDNDDPHGRDYHGYWATDLYSVEEHFGTLQDYVSLVKAAHQRGLKVILDIVPNHVGPSNPWVMDPPTSHWFHGTRKEHSLLAGELQHLVDPYASPGEWRNFLEGWFPGRPRKGGIPDEDELPDMGTDDPTTSQFLRQNAIWWAETGALDGFRLDTFPYVDRRFWHDFHSQLHDLYPRFKTVGEVLEPDPSSTTLSFFVGGKVTEGIDTGVDTLFDFPLYVALRNVVLNDAPAASLERVLQQDWLFPHPESLVILLGNHDKRRFMGEKDATAEKIELAFAFLLTMRGIPQIYYGDEIGLSGGEDPDNRRDFLPDSFSECPNVAAKDSAQEQKIFKSVCTLLHLRQRHPALRRGGYVHIFSDDQTFVFARDFHPTQPGQSSQSAETLLMLMNTADRPRTVEVKMNDTLLAQTKMLARLKAEHDAEILQGPMIKVELPARSLSIYTVK